MDFPYVNARARLVVFVARGTFATVTAFMMASVPSVMEDHSVAVNIPKGPDAKSRTTSRRSARSIARAIASDYPVSV